MRGEHAAHPQRIVAELRPQPFVAARRGVAFVENEIDDLQHRGEPFGKLLAARGLVSEAGFGKRPLRPHDPLGNGRLRQQEGTRDLVGGQAADHPQSQRGAGLARQTRMAGRKDQAQQFVADVVVEAEVQIGHGLLLLLHVPRHDCVLAREHPAAAQLIQRPPLGDRHQPRAGFLRNACNRPMLDRRQQRFLRQVLGQRHVAQHPRQAGEKPRLLDAPDRKNRAMDVGFCHRRRLWPRRARLKRRPAHRPGRRLPPPARRTSSLRRCLPSPAYDPCGAA